MGRPKKQPAACTGPGCSLPAYSRGLCRGHYAYSLRHPGEPLRPLRAPDAPTLVRVSVRVTEHCAAAAHDDPAGARSALEAWAAGRTTEHQR